MWVAFACQEKDDVLGSPRSLISSLYGNCKEGLDEEKVDGEEVFCQEDHGKEINEDNEKDDSEEFNSCKGYDQEGYG